MIAQVGPLTEVGRTVTAAPIEIARIIARRLGLTGALGTVAEHEDGVYTGHLVGEMLHGPAKGEAIKALAAREGLDLRRCSAYSDSYNDLPMLSWAGRSFAVANAHPEVRDVATDHIPGNDDDGVARTLATLLRPTGGGG